MFSLKQSKKERLPDKEKLIESWYTTLDIETLYNSTKELRIFEFADTSILSNSNLPYWNSGEEITIWIRMVLDDSKLEPFDVEVSVNCENAEGFTKRIKINPKDLLKSIDSSQPSKKLNDQIQGDDKSEEMP